MQKKVLIDLERLRYPNSGIANVFRNLAKGLLGSNSTLDVSYFGNKEQLVKLNQQLPCVFWNKMHKFYERFSGQFSLIHVSHQLSSYFHKNYKHTRKIVTLHDLNFLHEDLEPKKKEKTLKKVNNNLRYADSIVFISDFVRQDFEKNKHLFTLKKLKSTKVIHNGICFPKEQDFASHLPSFLKQKQFLLNIGVLFPKKNQLSLVAMLPFVKQDLVLVVSSSKSSYEEEVREFIHKHKLEERVHVVRNISNEQKFALLQSCEALLQPSFAEGFGIPPIEAMHFGKPVFLSKYTSLPEIGGDAAFYFDSFEAKEMADTFIYGMNRYKNAQPMMQNKIKDWASKFDYRVMAKNYLDYYQEVQEL